MATYENPQVNHSVNVSSGSALREFISLSCWLILAGVVLVVAVFFGMRWLLPWMPFSWEQRMAAPLLEQLADSSKDKYQVAQQRTAWLQALAERLQPHMQWPADMPIQVHWLGSSVPNAFATLGGHIFIHQGLLDRVRSENAVAMVLAHEMAHIKHRDPLLTLGNRVTVGLALQALLGSSGIFQQNGGVIGTAAVRLTQLGFSRQHERAADAVALAAIQAHYGHLLDADAFFASMLCEEFAQRIALPQFLQTHPDTAQRVQTIRMQALTIPAGTASTVPLPAFMQHKPVLAGCTKE